MLHLHDEDGRMHPCKTLAILVKIRKSPEEFQLAEFDFITSVGVEWCPRVSCIVLS